MSVSCQVTVRLLLLKQDFFSWIIYRRQKATEAATSAETACKTPKRLLTLEVVNINTILLLTSAFLYSQTVSLLYMLQSDTGAAL